MANGNRQNGEWQIADRNVAVRQVATVTPQVNRWQIAMVDA